MPYLAQATVDELVRAQHELAAEVARLRVDVAGLRTDVRTLAAAEADDDQAELIEAARAAFAGRLFVAAELLAAALRKDAAGIRLAALIRGRSVRSTGKALRAACGKRTRSGLVLCRAGDSAAGVIWHVGEFQTHKPTSALPPALSAAA